MDLSIPEVDYSDYTNRQLVAIPLALLVLTIGSPLLPAVGLVLVFGLLADLMNTYLLNVSLLRYYKYEAIAQ